MTQSIDQDVQLSPHIMDVYGYFFRPEKRRKDRKQVERASPPSVTTNAITHALISPYPHTRCVFCSSPDARWAVTFFNICDRYVTACVRQCHISNMSMPPPSSL